MDSTRRNKAAAAEGATSTTTTTTTTSGDMRRPRTLLLGAALLVALLLVLATASVDCRVLTLSRSPASALDLLQNNNNEQQLPPTRFKRHASDNSNAGVVASPAAAAAAATLKQAQQALLEGDEQVLRRQLPDLIAQAHQDKMVERALLRMLINASLRSSLSSIAQQAAPPSSGSNNNWQLDNDNTLTQYNREIGGEFVPIRAARMEQQQQQQQQQGVTLDNADLSALAATMQQLNGQLLPLMEQQQPQQFQQFQPPMDKREYIKPCSFNAISCVRTPFRKL